MDHHNCANEYSHDEEYSQDLLDFVILENARAKQAYVALMAREEAANAALKLSMDRSAYLRERIAAISNATTGSQSAPFCLVWWTC